MKLIEKIATQVEELPSKVLSVEEIQDIVVPGESYPQEKRDTDGKRRTEEKRKGDKKGFPGMREAGRKVMHRMRCA